MVVKIGNDQTVVKKTLHFIVCVKYDILLSICVLFPDGTKPFHKQMLA